MDPRPGHHPSDVRQDAAMISNTVVTVRQQIVPLGIDVQQNLLSLGFDHLNQHRFDLSVLSKETIQRR